MVGLVVKVFFSECDSDFSAAVPSSKVPNYCREKVQKWKSHRSANWFFPTANRRSRASRFHGRLTNYPVIKTKHLETWPRPWNTDKFVLFDFPQKLYNVHPLSRSGSKTGVVGHRKIIAEGPEGPPSWKKVENKIL